MKFTGGASLVPALLFLVMLIVGVVGVIAITASFEDQYEPITNGSVEDPTGSLNGDVYNGTMSITRTVIAGLTGVAGIGLVVALIIFFIMLVAIVRR